MQNEIRKPSAPCSNCTENTESGFTCDKCKAAIENARALKTSQSDTLRQVAPDFRMSDARISFIKGKPYLIRVCEELIGDRWEGFVSMIPCRESATIN